MTKKQFLKSKNKNFSQVYFGKDRCCRCGCGGHYIATTYMINPRSKVNDDLFNEKLNEAKVLIETNRAIFEKGENFVNISYGENRALTFYFDEI